MIEKTKVSCPDCDTMDGVGRREFLLAAGGTAVTLAGLELVPKLAAAAQPTTSQPAQPRAARPAEALVRELYDSLSDAQKQRVVYPWNHGAANNMPATRLRTYNAAIFANHNIGAVYSAAQKDLNERILRAICSDEEGHRRITRNGTFDGSQTFDRCGAYIFGDPTNNQQYAWVFAGHHLTVRCDGNSEPNAAFGGPMYYGHSPAGYSQRNVFNFQTRSVLQVWDALSEAQRRQATMASDSERSITLRREGFPGIRYTDLSADQRTLVATVMRDLVLPFRREDADEVMDLVRRNGGMDRLHFGFFKDRNNNTDEWNFWRVEGPGFVWNYRVLDHVHCFVNIALQPAAPVRG